MCEARFLETSTATTILSKLETMCVALERVHDAVTVCREACIARTDELTAVANTLRHGAACPLMLQLTELAMIIVQLRNGKVPES
jgi:hypothetical protein